MDIIDIAIYDHNGVLSAYPNKEGRLGHLYRVAPTKGLNLGEREYPQAWLFASVRQRNEDGYVRFDVVKRGAVVGTFQDGIAFLNNARKAGLFVSEVEHLVPFSNGPIYEAVYSMSGQSFDTYSAIEMRIPRIDLPTVEELRDAARGTISS